MSNVPPAQSADNPSGQPPHAEGTQPPAAPPSYPVADSAGDFQQDGAQAPHPQQVPSSQQAQYPQQAYPVYPQQTYSGAPQAAVYPQGYQQPYAPATRSTNVLSIISFVLSLVGFSIGAVITGHISLSQIKKTGEQGNGMAIAGLVIGYIGCALWVLFWVFMIVFPLVMAAMVGSVQTGRAYGSYLNS